MNLYVMQLAVLVFLLLVGVSIYGRKHGGQ